MSCLIIQAARNQELQNKYVRTSSIICQNLILNLLSVSFVPGNMLIGHDLLYFRSILTIPFSTFFPFFSQLFFLFCSITYYVETNNIFGINEAIHLSWSHSFQKTIHDS